MKYSRKFLLDIAKDWRYLRNAAKSTYKTKVEYGFRIFLKRGKYILSRVIVGDIHRVVIPYVRGMVGALHTHSEPASFSDYDKYTHLNRYVNHYSKYIENPNICIEAIAYIIPNIDTLVIEAWAGNYSRFLEYPYIHIQDYEYIDYGIKIYGPIPINLYSKIIETLYNRKGGGNLPVEKFLV